MWEFSLPPNTDICVEPGPDYGGGQRGNCPIAPDHRGKGAPVIKFICFK